MPGRQNFRETGRRTMRERREDRWLFVCEGVKTEPEYLRKLEAASKLRGPTPCFDVFGGKGTNLELVGYTKRWIANKRGVHYAKVFVVFDNDVEGSEKHFSQAVEMCCREGYIALWSNACFELWLLLHVNDLRTSLTPDGYRQKLCKAYQDGGLGYDYDKTSDAVYEDINRIGDESIARVRAKKLYREKDTGKPPHGMSPCTTMYEVLERLEDYREDRTED